MLESFPKFYTACVARIEVVVLINCNWVRAGGVEKAQKGYCMLGSLGRDRAFCSVSRQCSLCHDMVLRLHAVAGS